MLLNPPHDNEAQTREQCHETCEKFIINSLPRLLGRFVETFQYLVMIELCHTPLQPSITALYYITGSVQYCRNYQLPLFELEILVEAVK